MRRPFRRLLRVRQPFRRLLRVRPPFRRLLRVRQPSRRVRSTACEVLQNAVKRRELKCGVYYMRARYLDNPLWPPLCDPGRSGIPAAAGPHAAPRPGELRPRMLGPAASCFESARRKGADRRPQNQPTIVPPGCTHAPGVAWPRGCSGPLSWSRTAPRDRAQGMLRPSEQDSWAAVCCPRKRILQGSES